MCFYRIHSYNIVEDLELSETEITVVHPTVLLTEGYDRHIVQGVEGCSLFGDKRLTVFGRIETELDPCELCLLEIIERVSDRDDFIWLKSEAV